MAGLQEWKRERGTRVLCVLVVEEEPFRPGRVRHSVGVLVLVTGATLPIPAYLCFSSGYARERQGAKAGCHIPSPALLMLDR